MEDDSNTWPPTPTAPPPESPAARPTPSTDTVIAVVMWALSASPYVLRFIGLRVLSAVCVAASLLLAIVLITRKQKAARLNGWLRLSAFALAWLYYLAGWYQQRP